MDGWLKTLIAAACVVVIAGGGYFAWKENGDLSGRETKLAKSECVEYAAIFNKLEAGGIRNFEDIPKDFTEKIGTCQKDFGIVPKGYN